MIMLATSAYAQSYSERLQSLNDFNQALNEGKTYVKKTSKSRTSTVSSSTMPCQVCFGTKMIQMGPGGPWITCTGCGGSGQWMTDVPVVPTVPQGGYNGGNSGNMGGSSSGSQHGTSTQSRPQTAKECGVCHGTGKCQTCNGTGRANNLMDLGTHQCVNCKSNVGKCQWCRGTGKQI